MLKYYRVGNIIKLMEDNTYDIKKYKYAKIHIEKLEAVATVIKASIKGFELFEIYQSSQECLYTLRAQHTLVQARINKYKKIIASKGKQ